MNSEVVVTQMTSKDKAYKIGGLLLGAFLIYSFTTDMQVGKLIMGIIFIFVSGYYKEIIVKKDGIEYTYNYFGIKKCDKLAFADIDEIVAIRQGKNHLAYFVKNENSQRDERLSIPPEKMDELIEFLKGNVKVDLREEDLINFN